MVCVKRTLLLCQCSQTQSLGVSDAVPPAGSAGSGLRKDKTSARIHDPAHGVADEPTASGNRVSGQRQVEREISTTAGLLNMPVGAAQQSARAC